MLPNAELRSPAHRSQTTLLNSRCSNQNLLFSAAALITVLCEIILFLLADFRRCMIFSWCSICSTFALSFFSILLSLSLSLSLSPLSPLSPLTLLLHHASIPPYPVPPTPPPLPQYFLTTSLVSHRSSIPYSWTMSTVTHLCLENHHKSSSKQH